MECLSAQDCPGQDSACTTRTCTGGKCGVSFAQAGTALLQQAVGDCQRQECDGAGGVLAVVDDSDLPEDDAPCTVEACHQGVLSSAPACGPNATCTSPSGSPACACNEGYFGDGSTCVQPAHLVKVEGQWQTAAARTAVPVAPVVAVTDAFGKPIPGVPVSFTVTVGNGTVDVSEAATDANGRASCGTWMLGAVRGQNQVRAWVAGLPPAHFGAQSVAVWPQALPHGIESAYADMNQGSMAAANDLLNNIWPARGHPPAQLAWPLTWTEDPYNDAFWRFMYYGLRYTSNLLWAYEKTGDTAYQQRLIEILESYVAYDASRPVNRQTFDNKHAAAYRAMILVNTYVKLKNRGVLPAGLATGIEGSLARLGTFLEKPENFEGAYNHGFNQALALLLLSVNFPALDTTGAWRTTGRARLQEMLVTNIDDDGVDIENSPFYHYYVMDMVSQIARWAEAAGETEVSATYGVAYRRMVHHAAAIVQPDGRLPMLGATASTNVPYQDPAIYGPLAELDPNFEWVFSRGTSGTPLPPGPELFPVSGLYVLRSEVPPGDLPGQTFLTFDSGIYRTDHSHLDALNLTFYSHGGELIRDSGLYTYEKTLVDYDYFHGTRSHNTVVVDGQNQPEGAATPLKSGRAGGSYWATGLSELYPGVSHVRTVVLVERGLVVVVDTLESAASHRYTQTWHPFADADIQTFGKNLVARRATTPKLAISQADSGALTLEVKKGVLSPMQGWCSDAYGKKVECPAIEYTHTGQSASFATLLAGGPFASAQPTIEQTWVGSRDLRRIRVTAGSTTYTVSLYSQGTPNERLEVVKGLVN